MRDIEVRNYIRKTLKKYKATLWNGRLCTIEKSICLIVFPIILSCFVDEVYYHRDIQAALYLFALYSLIFICFILIWSISSFIWFYFLNRYVVEIRMRLFERFCFMKQVEQDKLDTAETELLFTSDATKFNDELASNYIDIFNYILGLLLSLVVVFYYDKWIFLTILILVPASYYINSKISLMGEKQNVKRRNLYGLFSNKIFEYLTTIHQIKVSGSEKKIFECYEKQINELNEEEKKLYFYDYISTQLNSFVNLVMTIMIYAVIAFEFKKDNITVGNIVAILEYVNIVKSSFLWFGQNMFDTKAREVHLKKVVNFLKIGSEKENFRLNDIKVIEGKVQFSNISFAYNDKAIFRNANVEINPHTRTAVIGANGAGKTTLAKLLLGVYELNGGNILIDNASISDYSYKSLRKQVSYVNQNIALFMGTIRDNITLWSSNYTDQDIYQACKKANILEVVQELPNKLDTIIGYNTNLSVGQRQRLLLARVFLQDRPIIIWDEATSSLDPKTETEIINNLCNNSSGKTVIIITHTVNCISVCEEVVLCEGEKLCKYSIDDENLKKHSLYKEMIKKNEDRG